MRVELDPRALEEPRWPDDVRARTFTAADTENLHSLLVRAYRHGGGSVSNLDTWREEMIADEEYDPSLWILAEANEALVGAALCWTSGFVKDLVVDEAWRRRGLGEALMRCVFATFAARRRRVVELKVHADNPGAIRLYERLGMRVVETICDGSPPTRQQPEHVAVTRWRRGSEDQDGRARPVSR